MSDNYILMMLFTDEWTLDGEGLASPVMPVELVLAPVRRPKWNDTLKP